MNKRRYHTTEFKHKLVRLVLIDQRKLSEVARQYNICNSLLYRWIKQVNNHTGYSESVKASTIKQHKKIRLEAQIKQLEKENEAMRAAQLKFKALEAKIKLLEQENERLHLEKGILKEATKILMAS